jgi:ribosomal protein S27E
MNMEGNFLSRFTNKVDEWTQLIEDEPHNKSKYEEEMSQYIIKCMPYMNQYAEEDVETTTNNDNVFNVKETQGLARGSLYTDYLIEVENQSIQRKSKSNRLDRCDSCENSNVIHCHEASELVCDGCGLVLMKLISDELTWKEEQETSKIINYSYKRENHFNEWLSQFQAQETTTIPDEVIEQLRVELKKMKIKKMCDITHAKVRGLLKKLKYNKYYEHTPYITNMLNGAKPPKMSQALEERLRMMFTQIQKPFDDNCPSERKNFLSYSYVLYKFCELLSQDQYLQFFPLLKSSQKLYQQDVIWKKICQDLHWEFIPTV